MHALALQDDAAEDPLVAAELGLAPNLELVGGLGLLLVWVAVINTVPAP